MSVLELLRQKRGEVLRVSAKHGARNIRVFGSAVRGEAGPDSDIDLLIDKDETTSTWFPAGLALELEEILGHRVEIVTEKSLNRHLRDQVLREAVVL